MNPIQLMYVGIILYRFMMVEVYESIDKSMKYYSSGADMPLNMWLISANTDCHAACYQKLIQDWLSVMPSGKWPNFVVSLFYNFKSLNNFKGSEQVLFCFSRLFAIRN